MVGTRRSQRLLGIPMIAAVPFEGQEKRWNSLDQGRYRDILGEAHTVHIVSPGGYEPWKMQARNEWMVDNCNILAAMWNGSSGGTANCIRYAQAKERKIDPLYQFWRK